MSAAAAKDRRALLSRLLRQRAAGGIPRAPRDTPLPLSFAQRRLWFLDHLGHTGSGYVIPLVATLEGPLVPAALQASLETVVRRHAVLRTRFLEQAGEPLQEEGPPYLVPLACREVDPATAADEAAVFTDTPIPLSGGQLLRARLWHTGPERHLLAIAVHHIAFDGWSIGVLGRELAALYSASIAGLPSPLPPLPIQYADFAVWQRSPARLAAQQARLVERATQIAALPGCRLRGERVPPAGRPRQGRIHRFALDAAVSDRLLALGQPLGATPFVVLLTGFLLLLARHEHATHPLVGCPIAGRDGAETEAMLGFFVNSLVIGTDLSDDPSFLEALSRVQRRVEEAIAAQDIPFEQIVERAQPERLFARNPVFEVMFAWQAPFRLPNLSPRVRITTLEAAETAARFDLECHAWRDEGRIHGGLIYDADRFDAAGIAVLANHFIALLGSAVEQPATPASRLPLSDRLERSRLAAWNVPGAIMPAVTLPDLFARAVRCDPDALAVRDGQAMLSFAALDRRANALALRLRAQGVTVETPVAMRLPRSAASVIVTLAVAKAGGTLLPLDPAWPAARQEAALAASGTRLVLDEAALTDASEAPVGPPLDGIGPERLAYLAFTSGSTGAPKCIGVPHAAVARLVLDTDYVHIGPGDRVAHLASSAFDASTFEIWGPLLNGATVLVIGRETVLEPRALVVALRQGGATIAFITTALLHRMAEDVPDSFACLHTLLFGGEACDPALVRRILTAGAPRRLLHVYGPTETTTFASWHLVAEIGEGALTLPIGLPVRGARLHIAETAGEAPIGVPGELLVAGTGMARGYIGAPDLTADRFRPDPWGPPGARLYRTGDLVRRRPDGAVEFLGRLDRQAKIRGFRVEPAEVEAALRRHPSVADAAVAVEDGAGGKRPGDKRMIAYAVPKAAVDATGRVADWTAIFDERIYPSGNTAVDPLFDTTGWRDSATGAPIPEPAMRAWAAEIVGFTLVDRPRSVLEIGYGTGMLLFAIAPHVHTYVGCEISVTAQASVQAQLDRLGWGNVRLEPLAADDLEGLPNDFDCVLLSSVVQYFPDAAYLLRVLRRALARLRPGGRVVLADLRNLRRRDLFHIEVALARAAPDVSAAAVLQEAATAAHADVELHLDPAFFAALPGCLGDVAKVELAAQGFDADNELTRYRFTAVLTKQDGTRVDGARAGAIWHDGRAVDAAAIAATLRAGASAGFRGLPDSRLAGPLRRDAALRGGACVASTQVLTGEGGFTPALLRALAPPGWQVAVAPGEGATLDALFQPGGSALLTLQPIATDPLALASVPAAPPAAWDPAALRAHLAALLPDWMLPAAIHRVRALPLNTAGKVDFRTLAASLPAAAPAVTHPLSETETVVAQLYGELLGATSPGPTDDFFVLGGHSLLASRLVAQLRDRLAMHLPLDAVFRAPTVAGLAAEIDALRSEREEGEI